MLPGPSSSQRKLFSVFVAEIIIFLLRGIFSLFVPVTLYCQTFLSSVIGVNITSYLIRINFGWDVGGGVTVLLQ